MKKKYSQHMVLDTFSSGKLINLFRYCIHTELFTNCFGEHLKHCTLFKRNVCFSNKKENAAAFMNKHILVSIWNVRGT